MGLGRLLQTRSTRYTATDTVTGASQTFTVIDNLGPDFVNPGTYRGGMSIPGAWRASVLLSDLLGQVPWDAYREFGGEPEEKIEPTPPLLEQPAPPDTRMTTFSSWALDLIWHGNAIGVVAARNFAGWPTAVWPVPAQMCSVRRVTSYMDSPLPVGALEYTLGAMKELGSQDVIHIKGPCEPGAVRGMGVLEAHLNTFALAQDQSKQARSLSNHGVPTGVLKSDNPDLTDAEAVDLKAQWLANQSTRSIAVLNASTTFTPLSWNPEQLQLVEARRLTVSELELIFGFPVGWLGGMNSARQYSNVEMDAVNLLKFSLGGHLGRFEQTLSLAFPRGTRVRANMDAMLRADTLTRYQAHELALTNGFLTHDEVREYEHRPPLPEKPQMPDAYNPGPAGGAGPKVRRFDPNQPRDREGQWTGSGMPPAVFSTRLRLAGGTATIDRRPGGNPRLTIGARSVDLSDSDLEEFRLAVFDARYDWNDDGNPPRVHRVIRRTASGAQILTSIRPVPGRLVDEDGRPVTDLSADGEFYNAEYDLVLNEGDDTEFDDEPSTRVSLRDIDPDNRRGIYQTMLDASAAERVDGGFGPIDVFVPMPGRVGFRMKGDDGKPVEVEFNSRDLRRIDAAIERVMDEPGTTTIDTAAGPVEVTYTESGSLIVSPPSGGPWSIAASGDGVQALLAAFTANGTAAGIFR